jgi:hypothetical protein
MGLSFTIAAYFRQRTHIWSVFLGTHDHFLLPDSRPPEPGGPGPYIYIPQEHGVPVI